MPATDSRLNEIGKIKNKILEIESQLKEEKKISAKLRANSEKKIHQLSIIDDAIAAEMESFRWKKENILFNQTIFENEALQQLQSLKRKENHIKQDIAGFDIVEFENEKLHSRLKEISIEQLSNAVAQSAERERRKQKNFDVRMQMEEILRKTIKNFDNNYQQEAISKMEQEALQANAENNKIHTEFEMREQKTENLIHQQQTSYDQLMRLRIERDVVAVSTEIQEKNIAMLKLHNDREKAEMAELSETTIALRTEIVQLRAATINKTAATKQLSALQYELQKTTKRRKKLCNTCIRLCHKMLYEGLGVAEKVRVYQSSQIAHRIGQIGELSIGEEGSDSVSAGAATAVRDEGVKGAEMRDADGDQGSNVRVEPGSSSVPQLPEIHPHGGSASTAPSMAGSWDPDSVWRTTAAHNNKGCNKHFIERGKGVALPPPKPQRGGHEVSSFYRITRSSNVTAAT